MLSIIQKGIRNYIGLTSKEIPMEVQRFNPNTGEFKPVVLQNFTGDIVYKYQLFDTNGKYFKNLINALVSNELFLKLVNLEVDNTGKFINFYLKPELVPTIEDVIRINRFLRDFILESTAKQKPSRLFTPERLIFEHILYAVLSKITNNNSILPIADNHPFLAIDLKENSITGFTKKLKGDLVESMFDFSSFEMFKMLKDLFKKLDPLYKGGYVNRDIKPENIYWDKDNSQLVLGDFGTVSFNQLTLSESESNALLGTYQYSSPELHETFEYSITTDMYSLVMTIWQLLEKSGMPPKVLVFNSRNQLSFITEADFEGKIPNRFIEDPFKNNASLYKLLKWFLLNPKSYLPNEFRILFNLIDFVIDPIIDDNTKSDFVSLFVKRKLFKTKIIWLKTESKYTHLESVQNLNIEDFNYLTSNTES